MTRDVATVSPYDSIEHAARLMRKFDCGSLPVTDDLGRAVGMITDRDIIVRLVARDADPRYAVVRDYMTDDVVVCRADDPVEGCLREMSRHRIRRIPIVDDRDRLVGILAQADVARLAGTHPEGRGERRAVSDTVCAISQLPGDSRRR
jgi:CBS domain-containing protein